MAKKRTQSGKKVASRRARRRPIGVGVIGLGFMGRTHLAAYKSARAAGCANEIVALCDRVFSKKEGDTSARGNLDTGDDGSPLFDPARATFYSDPAELLADPAVELVSICTHTPSHVELALAALRAGKHVLVEKPLATRASEARRLQRAAQSSDRLCMPAMCLRFWPAWRWLRDAIHAGTYGPVRSAVFRRIASHPGWSKGFYRNHAESGGALFDLHIHDADFVRFCFGPPESVASTGDMDHVTTLYRYANGPAHVVAEGGWDCAPGFAFEMNYTVVFERATADFRLERQPPLRLWNAKSGRASAPRLAAYNGYEGEVRHLLKLVRSGARALEATVAEAADLTQMLEAEQKSLTTGRPVRLR